MSSYGSAPVTANVEGVAIRPNVTIANSMLEWASCSRIHYRRGITPSKAYVSVGGGAYDLNFQYTLNGVDFGFLNRAPVEIEYAGVRLFVGYLSHRADVGGEGDVRWVADDSRVELAHIFLNGALVYDEGEANEADRVKWMSAFDCSVSPRGLNNCVGAQISGIDGLVPVFSAQAEAGAGVGYNTLTNDNVLKLGEVGAWTGAKLIKYLNTIANLAPGSIPGITAENWRYLTGKSLLKWDAASCNFSNVTSGGQQSEDAMSKKLPARNYNGMSILNAVEECLQTAGGVYSLGVSFGLGEDAQSESGVGNLFFYGREKDYASPIDLSLGRAGLVSDIESVVDFELDENPDIAETVIMRGDVRRLECPLVAKPTNAYPYTPGADDTLLPAWSADEQKAQAAIIRGSVPLNPGSSFAVYPTKFPTEGQAWVSGTVLNPDLGVLNADGNGGRPLIRAYTNAAIQLARQLLPNVWLAYKPDSEKLYELGYLTGADGRFADTDKYPYLKSRRELMAEQLQHFLDDIATGAKLNSKFPVRVEISDQSATAWREVRHNCGLEIKNGLIYFNALTDDNGEQEDLSSLYTLGAGSSGVYTGVGAMKSAPHELKPRWLTVNIAMPLDHRCEAIVSEPSQQVDGALSEAIGGGPVLYVENEAFREYHQKSSRPSIALNYPKTTGDDETEALSRLLVDDTSAINGAAQRKLSGVKNIKRNSSWEMFGIKLQYAVGMFLGKVSVYNQSGDRDYLLNSAIDELTLDFDNQRTGIGDVTSEGSAGEKAGRQMVSSAAGSSSYTASAPTGSTPFGRAEPFSARNTEKGSSGAAPGKFQGTGDRLNKYGGKAGLEMGDTRQNMNAYEKGSASFGGNYPKDSGTSKTGSGDVFEKDTALTRKSDLRYVGGNQFTTAAPETKEQAHAREGADLMARTKRSGGSVSDPRSGGKSLSEQGKHDDYAAFRTSMGLD